MKEIFMMIQRSKSLTGGALVSGLIKVDQLCTENFKEKIELAFSTLFNDSSFGVSEVSGIEKPFANTELLENHEAIYVINKQGVKEGLDEMKVIRFHLDFINNGSSLCKLEVSNKGKTKLKRKVVSLNVYLIDAVDNYFYYEIKFNKKDNNTLLKAYNFVDKATDSLE